MLLVVARVASNLLAPGRIPRLSNGLNAIETDTRNLEACRSHSRYNSRYFGIDSNSEERVEQAEESIEGREATR